MRVYLLLCRTPSAIRYIDAVRNLYDAIDNSLRFTETEIKDRIPAIRIRASKDLRGVKCPLYFVKTKLVHETLLPGEELEIYIDDGETIENVPASLINEGDIILKTEKKDSYWCILIKKES